jgi:CHAD domain-containing protein
VPVSRYVIVNAAVSTEMLLEKVKAFLPLRFSPEAEYLCEYFDTYDFRLFSHGYLLQKRERRYELVSLSAADEPGVLFSSARTPRLNGDFRRADLRRMMKGILGPRALLSAAQLRVRRTRGLPDNRTETAAAEITFTEYLSGEDSGGQVVLRLLTISHEAGLALSHLLTGLLASLGLSETDDFTESAAQILAASGRYPGEYELRFSAPLDKNLSVAAATQLYGARLVSVIRETRGMIIEDVDPEFLHDYRVAVRRLRSWLEILDPYLDAAAALVSEAAKLLGNATNDLRDFDVLLINLESLKKELGPELKPWYRGWQRGLRSQRKNTQKTTAAFLRSPEAAQALTALEEFCRDVDRAFPSGESGPVPLSVVAGEYMARVFGDFLKRLKKADKHGADDSLHRLRVSVKKVRYGVEALAPCLTLSRLDAFLKIARSVQEDLGSANDCAVGRRMLGALAETPAAAGGARDVRRFLCHGAFLQLLLREEKAYAKRGLKSVRRLAKAAGKRGLSGMFKQKPPAPPAAQDENAHTET